MYISLIYFVFMTEKIKSSRQQNILRNQSLELVLVTFLYIILDMVSLFANIQSIWEKIQLNHSGMSGSLDCVERHDYPFSTLDLKYLYIKISNVTGLTKNIAVFCYLHCFLKILYIHMHISFMF